jgi:hypothetical protein
LLFDFWEGVAEDEFADVAEGEIGLGCELAEGYYFLLEEGDDVWVGGCELVCDELHEAEDFGYQFSVLLIEVILLQIF